MTKIKLGSQIANFTFDSDQRKELDFYKETKDNTVILYFLRYVGCPVCTMEMAALKKDYTLLESKNCRLYVVLQGSRDTISSYSKEADLPFDIICDEDLYLFNKFHVESSLLGYLNPKGLLSVIKSTFKGHFHGKFEGNETQMPATFILNSEREIQYMYYGTNIGDVPPLKTLIDLI